MTDRKKHSGRAADKVGPKVPGNSQPDELRSVEAQLQALIAKFAPTQLSHIGAIRRWFRERLPAVHEVVYAYNDCAVISYSPSGHGYEGLFAIRTQEGGIRLYFNRGKELPDPAKLLKGSGKLARWIELENASRFTSPEVALLIEGAIALNDVPFAATGAGSMIMRLTSAKR
jgi:hypothetical protein